MRSTIVLTLVLVFRGMVAPPDPGPDHPRARDQVTISVMTYNIRYNNPEDGPHAWPHRREAVITFLRSRNPDILCVQEALADQIDDLQEGLSEYAYRGVGRDDGKTGGEYSAIFFKSRRFQSAAGGTIWLSPTPDRPSRGWDAALPRIATWAELVDQDSRDTLFVVSTHFDHEGVRARAESASLLRSLVCEKADRFGAIVAGDFNCEESEEPYRRITERDSPRPLMDARRASADGPTGPEGTYSGFALSERIDGPRIDYIFVTDEFFVQSYETIRAVGAHGFLSDHLPVFAIMRLR